MPTKHYGLIGNPLRHSFSADFFADLFARERIDASYAPYELQQIEELEALLQRVPLVGLNVTAPYKQAVLRYATTRSPEVVAVGAANVLRIRRSPTGEVTEIEAFNTDVVGFSDSLRPMLRDLGAHALVLGSGGAALAVRHALQQLGIEVWLVSRNPHSAGMIGYDALPHYLPTARLVVNATPLGLHADQRPNLPYDLLGSQHLCYDLIYNPAETPFLREAMRRGAQTMNGLNMLHGQARAAWAIWQAAPSTP